MKIKKHVTFIFILKFLFIIYSAAQIFDYKRY